MPYVDPATILKAKEMDLLTYLQTCDPHELVRIDGNAYTTRTHDSLKISNGKWMWWSQGIGGKSALDYLIKVNGLSFLEAVEQITGRAAVVPSVPAFNKEIKPKTLLLPTRYPSAARVITYLQGRGIDSEIIYFCTRTGRLYESSPNHNAVFVGMDKDGTPKYANLRSVCADFKGDANGSDKRYSFAIPAEKESNVLHLFESAIDLLSYATMLKLNGRNWHGENLLSLAGVYQPKDNLKDSSIPLALSQFLKDYPNVYKIRLHLDNDLAGRCAAQALMSVIPKEYSVYDCPPPQGQDCNDYLRMKFCVPSIQRNERNIER